MTRSYCKQPESCTAPKNGACLRCVDKMFERDDAIVRAFIADETETLTSLAKRFDVGVTHVSRLLNKRNVDGRERLHSNKAAASRARHAVERGFAIPDAITDPADKSLFVALAKKFDPSRAEQIMLGSQQ